MTVHFYVLPIERNGSNRGPKYFSWQHDPDPPGIQCAWSMKDYGSVDMAVLCADIQDVDHAFISAQADVYALPDNMDASMTASDRSTANTYLEAHGIPGDWIAPSDTFRSMLRVTTEIFLYLQRVLALIGYPQDAFSGLTLNTQYHNIPNPLHDAMQQAAIELGYLWNVNNNDQIRKIFKMMADQWGNAVIYFGMASL